MLELRTHLVGTDLDYYALSELPRVGLSDPGRLPMTVKILLEMLVRDEQVSSELIQSLAQWSGKSGSTLEVPFRPCRVLLHDYTGIPAVVDLAAMRSAMQRAGKDPRRINPIIPAHMVIDHSAQVNHFGSELAFRENLDREYERNRERFTLLRWAQQSFDNFTLIPPGRGICHQINLE
jgi:aconitate hydratase